MFSKGLITQKYEQSYGTLKNELWLSRDVVKRCKWSLIMDGKALVAVDQIESIILHIRGQKIILSHDLAQLYGVTTGNLNKAVKRNIDRFPENFMLRLTEEEYRL
jgi:hypothetical protein